MSEGGRSLPDVAKRILAVIPEEETKLRARIKSCSDSAAFAPPEAQANWWHKLCGTLDELLPQEAEHPWQTEVGAIIRGEK